MLPWSTVDQTCGLSSANLRDWFYLKMPWPEALQRVSPLRHPIPVVHWNGLCLRGQPHGCDLAQHESCHHPWGIFFFGAVQIPTGQHRKTMGKHGKGKTSLHCDLGVLCRWSTYIYSCNQATQLTAEALLDLRIRLDSEGQLGWKIRFWWALNLVWPFLTNSYRNLIVVGIPLQHSFRFDECREC